VIDLKVGEEMGRQYRKASIVEAVCEFRLPNETPWDLTIPGLIYEKLKNDFPQRQPVSTQSIEIVSTGSETHQKLRNEDQIQLSSSGGEAFIRIGERVLNISVREPYPGWERMKETIAKAFEALKEVIELSSINRIGVRYINRFIIPKSELNTGDYFTYKPTWQYKNKANSLMARCTFSFDEGKEACTAIISDIATGTENQSGFVLDFDYYNVQTNPIPSDKAFEWIEKAHTNIEILFEESITDLTRREILEVAE
jgi:uncharacterized protein (TIGR04255 family)